MRLISPGSGGRKVNLLSNDPNRTICLPKAPFVPFSSYAEAQRFNLRRMTEAATNHKQTVTSKFLGMAAGQPSRAWETNGCPRWNEEPKWIRFISKVFSPQSEFGNDPSFIVGALRTPFKLETLSTGFCDGFLTGAMPIRNWIAKFQLPHFPLSGWGLWENEQKGGNLTNVGDSKLWWKNKSYNVVVVERPPSDRDRKWKCPVAHVLWHFGLSSHVITSAPFIHSHSMKARSAAGNFWDEGGIAKISTMGHKKYDDWW